MAPALKYDITKDDLGSYAGRGPAYLTFGEVLIGLPAAWNTGEPGSDLTLLLARRRGAASLGDRPRNAVKVRADRRS